MTRLQEMKLIAEGAERNRLEVQKQLDAQRLRADTAEDELKAIKESLAYRGSLFGQVQAQRDAAEQRIAKLEAALKFYADRDHYSTDDGLNWDSCSGEPSNILWHEEQPWFIEDGTVARACLDATAALNGPAK